MDLWIADSGGTKTDWIGVSGQGRITAKTTIGMNPNILGWPAVRVALKEFAHQNLDSPPQAVYFFGAGLGEPSQSRQMKELLDLFFESKKPALIGTDLEAAAIASLGWNPGTVCILGTGSVAVRFDGTQVVERKGGHGYLLGDEGGGSQLGMQFLKHLFAGKLDSELMVAHQTFFKKTPDQWRKEVYTHHNPVPIFTAQTPFLSQNRFHPQISAILESQFRQFFEGTLLRIKSSNHQRVVMLGGIAKEFQEILINLGTHYQLNLSLLKEKPVNSLAKHLLNKFHPEYPLSTARNLAAP